MRFKGFTLNDFQVQAAKALEKDHSVLVSAPTGAGKTLIAELAIHRALKRGKRAIYTAPIKALSNQKFRDFRDDPEVEVGLMTGDVTINPNAPLLIMTTEIFRNTVFEAPERFDQVDYLIFDEVHYLDDRDRGTVWEESMIFAPEEIKLVCLSATIANLEIFGNWIGSVRKQPIEIIREDRRPVPLKNLLFHEAVGEFPLNRWEPTKRKVASLLKELKPAPPRRRHGPQKGGRFRNRTTHFSHHLASRHLLDKLTKDGNMPILYFCFSRRECEVKAERNSSRKLLKPHERKKIGKLFDEICDLFQLDPEADPELRYIEDRALLGIGFHHAGMLPIHKEVVERLFTSGILKLLFTTETFALGINMPAKVVVFNSLRKFDGVDFDYMRTRDYLQMAGRAGRQGMDKVGLVFSVLDNEDLKDAPLRRILEGDPEPVGSHFDLSYSSLMNLFDSLGRSLVGAYEKSFHYFMLSKGAGRKKRAAIKVRETTKILRKLNLLEEAGYLDDEEGLLPRAKIARQINGYEIQITELLFQGVLDPLTPEELAGVFTSLVFEERRGTECLAHFSKHQKTIIHDVDHAVRRFVSIEVANGFEKHIKLPDFGLFPATVAWCQGYPFEDLTHYTTAPAGDLVRTFRMAIQMLRQLQHALTKDYPLHNNLEYARIMMNRDVVDAKRQLELG